MISTLLGLSLLGTGFAEQPADTSSSQAQYQQMGKDVALVRIVSRQIVYPQCGHYSNEEQGLGHVLLQGEVLHRYAGGYPVGHRFYMKLNIVNKMGTINKITIPSYAVGQEFVLPITPTVSSDYLPDEGEIVPIDFGDDWARHFARSAPPVPSLTLSAEERYLHMSSAPDAMRGERHWTMYNCMQKMQHASCLSVTDYEIVLPSSGDMNPEDSYCVVNGEAEGKPWRILLPLVPLVGTPSDATYQNFAVPHHLPYQTKGQEAKALPAVIFYNDEHRSQVGESCITIDTRKGAVYAQGAHYQEAFLTVKADAEAEAQENDKN